MTVRATQEHRPVAQHRIEVLAGKLKSGGVDLYYLEPQRTITRILPQTDPHLGFDFCRCAHLVIQAALLEFLRALRRMSVSVNHSGKHQSARKVDRLRPRPLK